jgi:hypothetical protein
MMNMPDENIGVGVQVCDDGSNAFWAESFLRVPGDEKGKRL